MLMPSSPNHDVHQSAQWLIKLVVRRLRRSLQLHIVPPKPGKFPHLSTHLAPSLTPSIQILEPYGYTETEAGICGALLIVVGLMISAVTSPLTDKYKAYLLSIKICVPFIAVCYLVFIFAPSAPSISVPYLIASLLGAFSFSLVPIALEWLVEVTYPVSPEIGSTVCWTGGQAVGAVVILIMDALKEGEQAEPPFNMKRALVFQAVLALIVAPLPLCLGLFGRDTRSRRLETDRGAAAGDGGRST